MVLRNQQIGTCIQHLSRSLLESEKLPATAFKNATPTIALTSGIALLTGGLLTPVIPTHQAGLTFLLVRLKKKKKNIQKEKQKKKRQESKQLRPRAIFNWTTDLAESPLELVAVIVTSNGWAARSKSLGVPDKIPELLSKTIPDRGGRPVAYTKNKQEKEILQK